MGSKHERFMAEMRERNAALVRWTQERIEAHLSEVSNSQPDAHAALRREIAAAERAYVEADLAADSPRWNAARCRTEADSYRQPMAAAKVTYWLARANLLDLRARAAAEGVKL